MKTRRASIAVHLAAVCLVTASLDAAWLAGCTTTVVDFARQDEPRPDSGAGGAASPEKDAALPKEDATQDATQDPKDATLDAAEEVSPDGQTWLASGPAYFVHYKCCISETDCIAEMQGDGKTCMAYDGWKLSVSLACESKGRQLYSLAFEGPCKL